MFQYGANFARKLMLALQLAALIVIWILFHPAGSGVLGLALVYVLAIWTVVAWVTFGAYLARSLAPFAEVLSASLGVSMNGMWLVPGAMALTTRSPVLVALGLATIINTTRTLVISRPPKGKLLPVRRRQSHEREAALFCYQPEQAIYFSADAVPGMVGALLLQCGIYALASQYPLPAAIAFAAVTALWVSSSIARGALKIRKAARTPHSAALALLTLLLTVTLTAVLMERWIVRETPPVDAAFPELARTPGMTLRVLQRLAHLPPAPKISAAESPKVVTTMVDPAPAKNQKALSGIPGVVLRPPPVEERKPRLTLPGSRFRNTAAQPLAFPFTGEYQLFRTSSGSLPKGAPVEQGSPLDSIYGTTNGAPMQTVAVQQFDPPIDLTNCRKVLVTVTSAEKFPVLVMMQLVTAAGIEDGGSDLLGMKKEREQVLEFEVPPLARPLIVRAIRISFQRPLMDSDKNVRIQVNGFTLQNHGF